MYTTTRVTCLGLPCTRLMGTVGPTGTADGGAENVLLLLADQVNVKNHHCCVSHISGKSLSYQILHQGYQNLFYRASISVTAL